MTNQYGSEQAEREVDEFRKRVAGIGEKDSVVEGHLSGIAGNTQGPYGGDRREVRARLDETAKTETRLSAPSGGSSVLGEPRSAAGKPRADIEDAARRAESQAWQEGEQASAGGERVARTLARQIKGQPLASLLIAGAVGLTVGIFLARR